MAKMKMLILQKPKTRNLPNDIHEARALPVHILTGLDSLPIVQNRQARAERRR